MKLKAIIIDDEEPARNLLINYLREKDNIEVAAVCNDGFSALKACAEHKPDLIFLDIQMPKLTGFELLEVIDTMPFVIFTTAFDEFAIKAFEANAVDYLLKPFGKERFFEAIDKVFTRMKQSSEQKAKIKSLIESNQASDKSLERIVVKKGSNIHLIPVDDIIHIEADGDYVKIHTEDERFIKENTLKYYENRLDASVFIRIHRSRILNIKFMDKIELYEKESYLVHLKNNKKLKASLSGYKRLKNRLGF